MNRAPTGSVQHRMGEIHCALIGYIHGWDVKQDTMDAPHGAFFYGANAVAAAKQANGGGGFGAGAICRAVGGGFCLLSFLFWKRRGVAGGVAEVGFLKTGAAQAAGFANAAGAPVFVGLVAGDGLAVIDAEFCAGADDFGFGQQHQRGVNAQAPPFDGAAGGEVGHGFKGFDVLRAAVGVAGIIDGVDADENVVGFEHFRPAQRHGEHHGVARGHVGDGDFIFGVFGAVGGHGDGGIGERGAAKFAQIDLGDAVFAGAQFGGNAPGGGEFGVVALAVGEREGVTVKAAPARQRKTGGGIQSAREQNHGAGGGGEGQHTASLLGTVPAVA